MRAVLGTAAAVVIAVAAGGPAADNDTPIDAKKLVGKWEPKEQQKDQKVMLEFTKDGKLTISTAADGKTTAYTGTYKVSGNKMSIAIKIKGEEVKQEVTVLRLTDGELETEDAKGKKDVLRRMRGND